MHVLGEFLTRGYDVTHIRVFGLPQRGRHTDTYRIQPGNRGEVGRGPKLLPLYQVTHCACRNILNVRTTGVDGGDFGRLNVNARNGEAGAREFDG